MLISYEQAVAYCKWRSDVVSKLLNRQVTYRLPTKEEWGEIAQEALLNERRRIEKEFALTKKKVAKYDGKYFLEDRKNVKKRVYSLFDSVSEMTLEKNVAMGSNNHQLTELEENLTKVRKYDSPNIYLGFRCIAEVD